MTDENDVKIPIGGSFLDLVKGREDDCERWTRERIATLGDKAPVCFEHLGTVLSLLDRASSCFWGCRGGDHTVEYFAGRIASSSRAAIRLMDFAFYDEALSLIRSIGEAANLLNLFGQDAASFEDWRVSTKEDRHRFFRPVHVRKRLEELNFPAMIDYDRYSKLCEVAVHITPSIRPNGHNLFEIPSSGGYGQVEGILIVLNELAIATSHATIPLPKLLQYEKERSKEIMSACSDLLCAIGGADIKGIDVYRAKVMAELRAELAKKENASDQPAD